MVPREVARDLLRALGARMIDRTNRPGSTSPSTRPHPDDLTVNLWDAGRPGKPVQSFRLDVADPVAALVDPDDPDGA